MDVATFALVAFVALLIVALVTPAVSFVKLRQTGSGQRLGPAFFTSVLIWLAFVLVFGFVMLVLLGMAIFAIGHKAATSDTPVETAVPVSLVVLVSGCVAGLALVGWRVHTFTAGKLHAAQVADPGPVPTPSNETES